MKVIITGTSCGIGKATALKFLENGHSVLGLDINDATIDHKGYLHCCRDVGVKDKLPKISDVDILINNAGVQNYDGELLSRAKDQNLSDIQTNLIGVINCTEVYGLQPNIKAVINLASVSAHNGAEFPYYVASKGGVLSYTKWTAKQIAKYGATCNSISFGGVTTSLNQCVLDDTKLWDEIMDMTPLKKWASEEECAEWIYFMAVNNKSCTGQDIIVDNGEMINHKFVWKE